VNIKEAVSHSYQLRRYAWSAKLPLSILTDFEEFSVFDCQVKPKPNDKPDVARINYIPFNEYLDRFDEIYDVFSKEAILKGSFDRYAQSTKGKKGTAEVDSEFLEEIESWRELLAKNIALRNPDLSIYELNYAVQKIIDRIIFLRISEDRGIEPYGQLKTRAESSDVYKHLLNHFKLAESKYNSGIFDFEADKITPALKIDDMVLKTIIQNLYYPKSPYEFSVLGVEILGNVYEQFLGKVIRLTAGHQAKVETKPEVKKAGGVYYTPQYIVEYIVKNTVGKLIEGKTPEEVAEIKILDPACGSGSFLIGAYTYLLKYHLDWYTSNKPKQHKKAIFQVRENEWYLTTAEKKRILLNNIFGVDIDPQAVEVTKLSLLLKLLEHESRESIDQQAKLGLEGVLPNLEDNIKCGNSLIGSDFYDTQQTTLFDEAEMRRINVFDWNDDVKGFGKIMKRGGFDVVIGNPPYITYGLGRGRVKHASEEVNYIAKHYPRSSEYKINSFAIFYEKGLQVSRQYSGLCAFIVPGTILINKALSKIRFYLLSQVMTPRVVSLNYKVFVDAEMGDCAILFAQNKHSEKYKIELHQYTSERWTDDSSFDEITSDVVLEFPEYRLYLNSFAYKILRIGKSDKFKSLGDEEIAKFYNGIKTGDNKKFISKKNLSEKHVPVIRGRDFDRYGEAKTELFVYFDPEKLWSNCNATRLGTKNKIIIRQTGDRIIATIDPKGVYCMDTVHMIYETSLNKKFLLGLLNSRFLNYYHYCLVPELGKAFAEIKIANLKKLPVPLIDFSNPTEKAQHDKLVSLVENMLEQQKKYHETRMERDKELYERQIKIVDAQIDRLVYELYGLRDDEIKVIEGMER
jgi:type I restriction-modification system DNA methylase subunit